MLYPTRLECGRMKIYLIIEITECGYNIVKLFLSENEAVKWAKTHHSGWYDILEIKANEIIY